MSLEKRIGAALAPLFLMMSSHGAAEPVEIGKPAPEFRLLDQHGMTHSVANYRGRWLVIYFYPKDDTPGCTTEACAFRDDVLQLRRMEVGLVGISTDDVQSHKEFANKYHLPFSLLSDRDGSVAQSYGSLTRIGPFKFAKRHTFVIGPEGRVERIYRDVNPKTHSQQVIGDLRALQAGG